MRKYFSECKTAEDVKRTYKEWAKKLHPDCGGDAEQFKEMSAEYERAFEELKTVHVNASGETYTKETNETAKQYSDIINSIIHFEDVTIEIIGSWIWLTGNTLPYKEQIKAAGFWWSKTKRAWYYNGDDKKSYRRGHYNMNELRNKWGSTVIDNELQAKLA